MADELENAGEKISPLAAAAKKFKEGEGLTSVERQEQRTNSTEQSTESTTTKTEEDAKGNGLQSETSSKDGEQEEKENGEQVEDEKSPEQIFQEGILKLKNLPGNEGKSEEELRTILKENAERSLHTDKEEISTEKPVVNLNDEIKKGTNGQFDSLEDIIEATKRPELTFANDQIKALNELASKGVDIEQVLAFQSLKIDGLDPTNIEDAKKLIRLGLRNDEPDITDKDIEYELNREYDLTEKKDELEEVTNKADIEYTMSKLSRNAKKVKDTLRNKQTELELPPPDQGSQKVVDKELANKQFDEWKTKVVSSLESYEALDIPLKDDQSFTFEINSETKETLRNTMTNTNEFLSRYVKEDGTADMEKYRRDMTILDNWSTISQSLVDQGDSSGAKRVLDSIQNPSSKDKDGVGGQRSGTINSPKTQIAAAMIKAGHI
jgi:hypothetical protein